MLADVRWYLDGRDGMPRTRTVTCPARAGSTSTATSRRTADPPTEGRHPFPTPDDFAAAMSSLGIGDDSVVVAYDDSGGGTAGRLVVMLRMLGRDAALLDGGLAAWTGPIETGPAAARRTDDVHRHSRGPPDRFATADETADARRRAAVPVLDARSRGALPSVRSSLVDPRPGHIPGARSAPWTETLDASGAGRSPDALRRALRAISASAATSDAIAYCGSGVSACMNVVAMEHAGLDAARLYVASWSGWSPIPDRPAETGG